MAITVLGEKPTKGIREIKSGTFYNSQVKNGNSNSFEWKQMEHCHSESQPNACPHLTARRNKSVYFVRQPQEKN